MADQPTKRTLSDIRPPSSDLAAKPAPVKPVAKHSESKPASIEAAPAKKAAKGQAWKTALYVILVLVLIAAVAYAYWFFIVKQS